MDELSRKRQARLLGQLGFADSGSAGLKEAHPRGSAPKMKTTHPSLTSDERKWTRKKKEKDLLADPECEPLVRLHGYHPTANLKQTRCLVDDARS